MFLRSRRFITAQCSGLAVLMAVTPVFASHSHVLAASRHKVLHAMTHGRHKAATVAVHSVPGQRGIDSDRTRAIQTALISKSYLAGEPSGEWDTETEAAMQKFQNDNGWQTKLMPDSRALIMLGLGPNGTGSAITSNAPKPVLQPSTMADSLASIHSISN